MEEYYMVFLPDDAKTYYGTKKAIDVAIVPRRRKPLGAVVLGPFTKRDVLIDWSANLKEGLHGYLLGDLNRLNRT